ncbi:c-type cytochrome [Pararhizobium sp. IMCC21322]|uniref:c-type cytochrome n=1 Tax=Pararhizobium sp. IMCC21322 TaxID=3067903 RepID=UPI002742863A|nr:c-type cytochrome [Pararhizobium sp. IMCC21322]
MRYLNMARYISVSGLLLFGFVHASSAGDVEYGAYLAAECASCHSAGIAGSDDGRQIPSIAGLEEETFMAVMQGYKSKTLENIAMQTIASGLDEEQLAALAAYFATLPTE